MEQYRNQQVVVLGLAKSGAAVAKLLHRFGAIVTVNDMKTREQAAGVDELESLGIKVITGGHPDDLLHPGISLVVKNPGIPYEVKPVQQALKLGIPVVTEVELAGQICPGPIIGITGSNGKTTTTTLVGEIMKAAQITRVVGGNIGHALSDITQQMTAGQWLVAELSSFQLQGTSQFHPRIAALLNLYPAHLDYHYSLENYLAAKRKLFANQTADDYAVLPYDQPELRALAEQMAAAVFYFSTSQPVERGVFVADGKIVYADGQGNTSVIMPVSQLKLLGQHNLENALAAALISKLAGASDEAIRHVLSRFSGVEHRLEYVTTIDGVKYYNDSKATNAEAAIRSISTFTEPVVLIAGGLDRGTQFLELTPVLQQHVKAIVTYGQTAEILLKRAEEAGVAQRVQVQTIEQAVFAAAQLACAGDVILLSPACASWDMFESFEVRGSMFKESVHKLRTSLG